MSSSDFIRDTTPAPPPPVVPPPPSSVDPWIGVIIFALVFGLSIAAATYAYKFISEKNEKHVQELRNQLREVLERDGMPEYPDPPYTLRVDADRMPRTKLPEMAAGGNPFGFGAAGVGGKDAASAARKRSKKAARR
jgi:hypothetical protein